MAYKIYVVFKNMSVDGKYIPLLYTANDTPGDSAVLPSDSKTYTLPSGTTSGEKEVYRLVDVVVMSGYVNTNYIDIWLNDQKTEYIIVNDVNTKDTVKRQFETIELYLQEGTSIKLKQAA